MKLLSNEAWIAKQFNECQLGNKSRTRRLQRVAEHMLARPDKSLPEQNPLWADLKAAYRLFQNEDVTFAAVCQQHWEQTRATQPGRYLLISDTTDIDHGSHQSTTGLSFLGNGQGKGMQLHSCLVYDSGRKLIEGTAGALVHYRKHAPKKETRTQRLSRVRESELWGNLVDQVGAPPEGSQWIHVFDRGGDNFEAMCHILQAGGDWVIRAARLKRNVLLENGELLPLADAVQQAEVLERYDLPLPSRPGIAARTASIELSAIKVTLPVPRHRSPWLKACGIQRLQVNIVTVQEIDPPRGVQKVNWVLLTSLPVSTASQARQVVEDYENRWLIEEYHKALKTGCSLQRHALRSAERLEPLTGLISVIGTRLLQLKMIGRSQRQAKARTHVPASWLECLTLAKPKLDAEQLTVYEFIRELAKLAGFLGRKCDGEPGWQKIWAGYLTLKSLLDGMKLAEKKQTKKLGQL